jgi:hypothetical protein
MPALYAANLLENAEPVQKEKRVPSEKQLAALQKAQETRKRKRDEANALKEQQQAEEEGLKKLEELKIQKQKEKKEAAAAKRKEKRDAKKQVPTPDASVASTQKKKRVAKPKEMVAHDDKEPPVWFKKYISNVKKEENRASTTKKPAKQVQEEVAEVAHKQWGDGMVRDRLRNEVDGHMNRMYGMIFGQRRMH